MATFVPFVTCLDTSFWSEVNKKKLHDWKLDESPKPISSQLSLYDTVNSKCKLLLSHESFKSTENHNGLSISGSLLLFNTLESFKAADKNELMRNEAEKIWHSITSREWLHNPRLLSPFLMVSFADLKKFNYVYWTCVPALIYPSEINQEITPISSYGADECALLAYQKKTSSQFFVHTKSSSDFLELSHIENATNPDDIVIVVADPSIEPSTAGWMVRNLLAAVAQLHPTWKHCHVISLRSTDSIGIKFSWTLPSAESSRVGAQNAVPKATGWEINEEGKPRMYSVNLRDQFNPKKLMEQSVDLNLSLMKWRLHPDIKLERFSQLKVLILGAGTLGCNISRGLIGWGVRHISFVDNSTVSYSNPVRQSLSEFEDARLGRGKAETAVAALQRIFPSIQASAHQLTVPMPGHTVSEKEEDQLEKDIEKLEQLVKEHDVVFLALDSREARWLPTVLANKHRKIAISVAIGFDTYVVIRHGIGSRTENSADNKTSEAVPYSQLSCYFCSDVTAPGNSTSDRTLDQQCTVSRPGTSMIASGLAVELLSSLLQYPDPLETPASLDDTTTVLGAAPHQIRGFIGRFQKILPIVKRFGRCVACGDAIAEQYQQNGWKFVRDVMNSPSRLEEVTGLDELQNSVNAIDIDFEDEDDDASVVSI